MPNTLVFFNPAAGRGRAAALWPEIEPALRAAGLDFDIAGAASAEEAMRLAANAGERYTTIVAVGSDGTLHTLVNGLLRGSGEGETLALGVLPLGSGDDFAKVLPPMAPVGGGFWFAPQAQPDDGLFDVLIMPALGRLAVLGFVPKMAQARHLADPRTRLERARRITVESPAPLGIAVDGELPFLGARRFEVEVLPRRLKILC